MTNQPWSDLLTEDDIHADGRLTVAALTETTNAGPWWQIVQDDDSLPLTPRPGQPASSTGRLVIRIDMPTPWRWTSQVRNGLSATSCWNRAGE